MDRFQSGDPSSFFRQACSVVAVARNSKERKVVGGAHSSKMFVQRGRKGGKYRVVDVAKMLSNALAEDPTCIKVITNRLKERFVCFR